MRAFRREKVASVIRQIVGEAVVHRLHDPRLKSLVSVTRVEMTADLQIARVYISVHGGDSAERLTLQAVQSAGGYLQRLVARELPLRQCPELRFDLDEGVKMARLTLELLAENRRNDPYWDEDMEPDEADDEADDEGDTPRVDPAPAEPAANLDEESPPVQGDKGE